jgi:hypothetical protein
LGTIEFDRSDEVVDLRGLASRGGTGKLRVSDGDDSGMGNYEKAGETVLSESRYLGGWGLISVLN